jgi:hypothetical protein
MSKELELFNRSRVGTRVVYGEDGVPIEIRPGAKAKVTLADAEAKRFQEAAEAGDDLQLAGSVKGSDAERLKAAESRSEMEQEQDQDPRKAAERPYLPRVNAEQVSPEEEKKRQEEAAKRAEEEGLQARQQGGNPSRMVNQPKPEAPKPQAPAPQQPKK